MITLVSLLFIPMISIDCKITNFSLYLFVCFFLREITIIISWGTHNKLLVENLLASTLHIHSFSVHYSVLNREQHEKHLILYNQTACQIATYAVKEKGMEHKGEQR